MPGGEIAKRERAFAENKFFKPPAAGADITGRLT
jgi:hypothetical protein